jgi:hypothetical protein
MADKPPSNSLPGQLPASPSGSNGSSSLPTDVEIRLRSTERVKVVLQQRCERSCAPDHLVVRIRETLISVTTRTRFPRQ